MKIKVIYFLTAAVFLVNCFAQNSVHLRDKLSHKTSAKNTFHNHPRITIGNNSLGKAVFGFLPYWELDSAVIRLDLLSHIALFDFVLQSDGSLTFPPEWDIQFEKWSKIINDAQSTNVKVIAAISNLTDEATDSILVSSLINNPANKNLFFGDVKRLIAEYNLDGVILDFENLKLHERGDLINNFTQELRDSLNTWFTEKELSFATPAVNWGTRWKLKELSEICDYLFIMAYDYHGSWSENAGPVAPLDGLAKNYHTTIENDYAGIDPGKLILGVPYYGAQWNTDNSNPYTEVNPGGEPNSNWDGNINYKDFNWSELKDFFVFDDLSQSTYLLTQVNSEYTLIWIDSEFSLSLKYDFALEKNLYGVGFWSLGKDGSYPELWNLIEEKFADTTTSVEEEKLVNDLILYQNYPNPFNPSTTIKFSLPSFLEGEWPGMRYTKLVVYDILGREIATLVNQKLQPGNHEIKFDASDLSSGIYIYRITVERKFNSVKKMLLIQ